jgi:NAD(P)-dependent dehydrogenase (short-subunit alcohol dehydrogenase family)
MKKIGVVTGANRGIGFALTRALCRAWGDEGRVYLTARDEAKAEEAAQQLRAEGLDPEIGVLDLAREESIQKLAEEIRQRHGGVDVLIQNGAMAVRPDDPPATTVRAFIDANNHGTYRVLRAFRPLLRPGARVLVVASGFGTLKQLDPRVRDRLDGDRRAPEEIDREMEAYVEAVEAGRAAEEGWPDWINIPSKVGQVALTRAFARALAREPDAPQDALVAAVCPGWTLTDAARPYLERMPHIQPKTPDEAAADVIWLATLPRDGAAGLQGELVQYRKVIPFREP